MADQKLTALTALAALSADDLFYVVDDPAGAATSHKLATSVLDARFASAAQGALAATAVQPGDLAAVAFSGDYGDLVNTPSLNFQPLDPTLTAFAALSGTTDTFAYFTGAEPMALTPITPFARTILDDANGPAVLATLGAAALAGDTFTGLIQFSGTLHAGLKLNSLTTVQRDALASPANGMLIYNTTDSQVQGYVAGAWGSVGGSSPPFTDTNALVKGSADPTKFLRFEIDGFTAGATRVMTPPNQDTLLAGQNYANVFTVAQRIENTLVMTGPLLLEGGDQLNGGMIAVKQKNGGGAVVTEFNEFGTIQAFAPNETENDWDVFGGGVVGDAWTRIGFQIDQGVPRLGLGPGNATDRLDTTMERNTGGGFIFLAPAAATVATIQANDAATNTINNVLIVDHGSSGTPAANYGTGLVLKGKSSTTASREMARLAAIWDTATDASRSAALKVLISGTSEVDAAKFDDDATAGNTRLFVYDVDNGQLERVSVGIADSGGLGFKLLRIAN